ncbi:hypothetical protein J2Y46_003878 [Microbacterium sp. BE35]|nr:hypothetical protein [Microbacterium sp. BE35]
MPAQAPLAGSANPEKFCCVARRVPVRRIRCKGVDICLVRLKPSAGVVECVPQVAERATAYVCWLVRMPGSGEQRTGSTESIAIAKPEDPAGLRRFVTTPLGQVEVMERGESVRHVVLELAIEFVDQPAVESIARALDARSDCVLVRTQRAKVDQQ